MVQKFLSSLTPLQKKFFYVAVFFVVLALFDRLLIGPSLSKLQGIDEDITKEESAIKGDLRFLSYKDRVAEQAKAIQDSLSDQVPKEEEVMAGFLNRLEDLAKQAEVVLVKSNRANEQKAPEEGAEQIEFRADLECGGSLDNIIKFIYSIDTSKELYKVVKMNLTMKKNGDVEEIKAIMTVSKTVFLSAPPPKPAATASTASNPKGGKK